MTTASATKANLDLSFPAAGVTFNIAVEPPVGGEPLISSRAASGALISKRKRLTPPSSPQSLAIHEML